MEKTVMSWSRRFDEGQLLKTILWVFSSDVPFSFQSTWNLCNSRFLVSLTNTLCQRKHAADSQPFCTALVAERSMTWLEGTWRDTVDLRVGKKIIGCDFVQRSEYEARAARDRNAAPYEYLVTIASPKHWDSRRNSLQATSLLSKFQAVTYKCASGIVSARGKFVGLLVCAKISIHIIPNEWSLLSQYLLSSRLFDPCSSQYSIYICIYTVPFCSASPTPRIFKASQEIVSEELTARSAAF